MLLLPFFCLFFLIFLCQHTIATWPSLLSNFALFGHLRSFDIFSLTYSIYLHIIHSPPSYPFPHFLRFFIRNRHNNIIMPNSGFYLTLCITSQPSPMNVFPRTSTYLWYHEPYHGTWRQIIYARNRGVLLDRHFVLKQQYSYVSLQWTNPLADRVYKNFARRG